MGQDFRMSAPDQLPENIFLPDGRLRIDLLTEGALGAIYESLKQAHETRWDSVRSPHVFMGILAVPDAGIRNWGQSLEEDLSNILTQFQELFRQENAENDSILLLNREFLSDNVIRLLRDAHQRAVSHGRSRVTPMDLLITMLTSQNSIVAECFENIGVTAAKLTELAVIAEHQAGKRE
jgi:ATP-dependent Clp protease ATP-binding subunit ClpA